ncbi:MAG: GNAT family N-acetyltransferase [Peptococcaceae bacterium]|nr:GNAT family N-acetyltransferase [Peptococcaceae bacterium]
MELDIRRLSPQLANDYMYYFKNDAFSDHRDWAGCFCLHFHLDKKLAASYEAFCKTAHQDDLSFSLHYAEQYVKNGIIQGYLAYFNNRVVGWCNANDKQEYAALKSNVDPGLWTDDGDKKVKSVVCFSVAPDMRGRGISTTLLECVCSDALIEGYDFIEGYPLAGECDMYAAHHGTVALFEKCGFTLHKQSDGNCIMRKLYHA